MQNGYSQFFKSARSNSAEGQKKVDIKKLKSGSAEEVKATIENKKRRMIQAARQRSERRFPFGAGLALVLCLGIATYVMYNPGIFEQALEKIEIGVLGQAEASGAEKTTETKAAKKEETATTAQEPKAEETEKVAAKSSLTEEEVALFKGLQERAKLLDQREQELKRLEEELLKQKEALEKRMVELEDTRRSIATQLEEKVKVDQERVDQLVQFYSSMKAQQAAKIIETLNEDLAVEVLLKMKKKSAAEIMNLIDAQKAQRLSEKFAGYRRK